VKAATDTHATIEELLGAVFYVRPVSIYEYNDQLPKSPETAVRRVGGWCEMADSGGTSAVGSHTKQHREDRD
jgi:hypothetical protein